MSLGDHFVRPDLLPLLLLAPAAGLGIWALERARARRIARALGARTPKLTAESSPGRRRLRRGLFAGALLLALFAALQPVWGEGDAEPGRVDVVVCLDVSRSMLARDVTPSRLERAKAEISALAKRAAGDRLGLVVFAGDARLLVPLTRDLDSFAALLRTAGTLSVPRGGTNLGAALDTALSAFTGGEPAPGAVLLLTDGDDLEGRGLEAAGRLAERGIPVHCAGLGSGLGAKIPVRSEDGESFLRDRAGREVVSALDEDALQAIARAGGGSFEDAGERPPGVLVSIFEERILPMARVARAAEDRRERKNRFQWPLLLAFVLWTVELCVTDRKRS